MVILIILLSCSNLYAQGNKSLSDLKEYVNGTDSVLMTFKSTAENQLQKINPGVTPPTNSFFGWNGSSYGFTTPPTVSNDMVKIGEYSPSGSETSYTISSIPSTYKILKLFVNASTTQVSGGTDYIRLQVNSDTGSNYSSHSGTSINTETDITSTMTSNIMVGIIGSNINESSSNFETTLQNSIDSQYKVITTYGASYRMQSTSAYIQVNARTGVWRNNSSKINSITLMLDGSNFDASSKFILYGLK